MSQETLPQRADFPELRTISTRWGDEDVYGHVNNTVYYSYFDTAVNGFLIEASGADIRRLHAIGLVVETGCRYAGPLAYPQPVEVGLAVEHVGGSSVRYRLGVFAAGMAEAAAEGHFTHVYVDRAGRRPVVLPALWRQAFDAIRSAPFGSAGEGQPHR